MNEMVFGRREKFSNRKETGRIPVKKGAGSLPGRGEKRRRGLLPQRKRKGSSRIVPNEKGVGRDHDQKRKNLPREKGGVPPSQRNATGGKKIRVAVVGEGEKASSKELAGP